MNHVPPQNAVLLLWHLEHCLPSRLVDGTDTCIALETPKAPKTFHIVKKKI